MKSCEQVVLTDYHSAVLEALRANVVRNGLTSSCEVGGARGSEERAGGGRGGSGAGEAGRRRGADRAGMARHTSREKTLCSLEAPLVVP